MSTGAGLEKYTTFATSRIRDSDQPEPVAGSLTSSALHNQSPSWKLIGKRQTKSRVDSCQNC